MSWCLVEMEATQMICDSMLESDEEENEETQSAYMNVLGYVFLIMHILCPPELPLFLGDNVLGRDPNTCTLPLSAASVSKQHATICISVYKSRGCDKEAEMEALLWDLGSMNGTRKGRLKLTPNVRYALSEGDRLVLADIPCQYVISGVDSVVSSQEDTRTPVSRNPGVKARLPDDSTVSEGDTSTGSKKCVNGDTKPRVSPKKTLVSTSCLSFEQTPTQPQKTLVPESDSDSDVSDSDSQKSSPTCSTFLSPTNKVVPERYICNIMYIEEGAAQGGTKSKESGQHVTVKHKSKGYAGEDGLPVSTPAVSTDDGPAFNIDSDTDMEEEEEGLVSAGPLTLNTNQHVDQPPNTVQFHMDSDTDIEEDEDVQTTKPSRCSLVIQPEDIGIDSNTDVDEDDDVLADAAMKAKPTSFKSARTADSASSMQLRDFHLDSGTDVDDEEEEEDKSAERHENSKTDGTLKPTAVVAVRESETDMEDNSPVGIPAAVTTCPVFPCKTSEARHSDSDADTDVDESSMPPAGNRANPAHLRVGGDKDEVEDKEADIEEAGEDRIPHLDRENTPGFLVPILQNCSTPVQESLQLRLSDSSHLQCQNQALATECTQAFVSVEGNVILEDAQSSDGLSAENDSNLEATQAYAENEDSARCSVAFKKEERHVDFALEATQAYISAPYSDSDDDTNQDEGQNTADAETQPIASTLAFAETQPMPSFVEETSSATDNSVCSVQQVPSKTQIETEEREEYKEDAHPQQRHISEAQCMAATQPICASSNEESDEDSFPGLQKRKAKPLQLEEEQTQSLTHSGADQTQAMATSEDGESDDTDWMPGPRKHKTKQLEETQSLTNSEVSTVESQSLRTCAGEQSDEESVIPCRRKRKANSLQLEDEQTQPLTSSDVSAVETQPIVTSEDKDSDDDDSVPGPPKRKVNQLHVEEEKTQQLLNSEPSAAENHPTATREDDDTDSMLGPRKRKAKHLEDKTQPLTSSEVSADDDSTPCRPKRKAKLQFEEEKTSTVETQPLKTKTGRTPRKGKETECKTETTRASVRNVRKSTAKSREGDEQAECSVPPRRQTRGENKTLQSTEEISEKSRSDDDDNNEEAVKQAKQTRGKKKVSKQKDDDEQKEMLEIERNKHAVNKSLINEQKEGKQQERDKLENEGKETERMENKCQARLESGAMEREETDNLDKEKEKQSKEKELQENKEEVDKPKAPTRGRRATRARASQHATQQEQESTNDDFPSRNTRSRSNSSNSVSSERSASSSNTQEGKGRGRGRGARTSSTSPQAAAVRTNHRRTTAAAVSTEQEVFDCSMTPVSRGRTGRLQGRGRRTEPAPDSIPAAVGQSDQDSSPKPTARGKKSRKPEGSSSSVLHENEKEKADSQQTRTTRGRQQTSASGSEHAAADETTQEEGCVSEESLLPKRNVRGRSQKVLFTGVVDEAGERVLARLGGSMAKGVADMNCLVTDKVRRTVKFLCAVAKGVPIVTTEWLEKVSFLELISYQRCPPLTRCQLSLEPFSHKVH
uniref:Mediator of DNA damage checkpoint 1 n=1 Tax=Stegastes partitus TaxID=144197 RepID=A0A3B5AYR7_9TELE